MPNIGTRSNAAARGYGFTGAGAEVLGGMVLMTPTSIASTGTGNSSSITANGSVTFSSCATLSLNGVFTSEYENYMVTIRMTTAATVPIYSRWRASGTDNSTTDSYSYQYFSASGTTLTGQRTLNAESAYFMDAYATQRSGTTIFIYQPQKTGRTYYRTTGGEDSSSALLANYSGQQNQSNSYDGFTVFTSSSMTGTISVYGLVGV